MTNFKGIVIPEELDAMEAQLTYESLVEAYNMRAQGTIKDFAGRSLVFFLQLIEHYNRHSAKKITLNELSLEHD